MDFWIFWVALPFLSHPPYLALRDGVAPKTDSLLRVEIRGLPKHTFYAAGTADTLVDSDFSKDLVTVLFFEGKERGLLFRNLGLQNLFQCGYGARLARKRLQ